MILVLFGLHPRVAVKSQYLCNLPIAVLSEFKRELLVIIIQNEEANRSLSLLT